MLELTKKQITGKYAAICIRVPAKQVGKITEATKSFLRLAGHEVRELNDEDEELFSVDEVFPDRHPGKFLPTEPASNPPGRRLSWQKRRDSSHTISPKWKTVSAA